MKIPWTNEQMDVAVRRAVAYYWRVRKAQAEKQARKRTRDAGTRGEVTGGKHLDAFVKILIRIGKLAGFAKDEMIAGNRFPIPGYYRPQKNWDFVFVKNGRLVAVVELKSQSGSFGNNCNNRAEEVLGVSHDFWKAYGKEVLGKTPEPWIGYFFLLEGDAKSEAPVRTRMDKSFLPPMKVFKDSSYMRRYEILCERLVLERDYSATSLLVTTKKGAVVEGCGKELSFNAFCESLYRHLVAYS